MTVATTERRATEVAAQPADGVAGLDRSIASLREAIAANERLLRRPHVVAWDGIERHPAPTKRPMPAWVDTALNWACAVALGLGLGYLAGKGF